MRIYTRKGDSGETGLSGETRVSKDAARIEVCGTVDELNTFLGLARSEPLPEKIDRLIERLQNELFQLGAELAAPDPAAQRTPPISPRHVQAIETEIDMHQQSLQPLKTFVLPGGTRAVAQLHVARAVCRRAERRLVTLVRSGGEEISPTTVAYLNRLGDLLFVLARAAGAEAGQPDVPWQRE